VYLDARKGSDVNDATGDHAVTNSGRRLVAVLGSLRL